MRKFLFLFLALITLQTVLASNYYGDFTIDVDSSGLTTIDADTNYKLFDNVTLSPFYTSKQGEFWVLNVSTKEIFEHYIFTLKLPENSQINYIKTTPNFRIEEEDNRIVLIGTGENKPFTLLVQYKINEYVVKEDNTILFATLTLIFVLFLGILIFAFRFKSQPQKETTIVEKTTAKKRELDLDLFSPRQQEIIKILRKEKKITQKELEERMSIPKSSISRNVKTLEIKGILRKEQVGHTNYLLFEDSE